MFHLILRPVCALLVSAVVLPCVVSAGEPTAQKARRTGQREVLTKVIQLEHADCELLAKHVRALFHEPEGRKKVTWYRPQNAILVRAAASEVEQIEQIVSLLDVVTPHKKPGRPVNKANHHQPVVKIIKLQHAVADSIAHVLRPLLMRGGRRGQGPPGVNTEIVVDERTNTVVILGTGKQIQRAMELVRELDVPVDRSPAIEKD